MKIDELKSKILQLAIQGKLVEQNSEDTPASALLDEIKKEKEQLIKEKKIKKEKPLPEITDEEKLFKLPNGWVWCKLGNISKIISKGTTPKGGQNVYKENGVNFLRVENITKNYNIDLLDIKKIDISTHEQELKRSMGEENDLLISIAGTLGRVSVLRYEHLPCNMNQAISFVRTFYNHISVEFLKYLLDSEDIKKSMTNKTKTTAQPNLTLEIIENVVIPLPPLEEQKRIVDKVEELFLIIDELNDNKEAMLKNILDSRNKVLQLAIQGRLVEQCEDDEPVEILLQRIAEEKELLIKEKKIKKEKQLPEIQEEEKLFDIPNGWEWCRLGQLSTIKGGKRVPAGYKLLDTPTNYMYIRVADMKNGTVLENDIKYISADIYEKIKNYYIESDDIYITIAGTIGRVGTIPERFNGANLTENASKIKCYCIDREYIYRILNSDFVQKQISDKTKKVGQPKLALNQIESLVLPIPPLEEQQRIVDKLDEIMSYLDNLEKTILEQVIM